MADRKKAVSDYAEEIKAFNKKTESYLESTGKYASSFTATLVEIWDDFIGKPREEGKEADKAKVMAAPTLPKPPTTKLVNPTASDFECGGNACKATFSEDGTRAFGVVGKLSGTPSPFDYPVDSIPSSMEPCRPKVMHVNVNFKKDVVKATQTVKFEFES